MRSGTGEAGAGTLAPCLKAEWMMASVGAPPSPWSTLRAGVTAPLDARNSSASLDARWPRDGWWRGPRARQEPAGGERILTAFFNQPVLESTGRTPSQWKVCHVRMLHKKGDTADVNNYRGISLLDVASKLYERVSYKRLEEAIANRGKPQRLDLAQPPTFV